MPCQCHPHVAETRGRAEGFGQADRVGRDAAGELFVAPARDSRPRAPLSSTTEPGSSRRGVEDNRVRPVSADRAALPDAGASPTVMPPETPRALDRRGAGRVADEIGRSIGEGERAGFASSRGPALPVAEPDLEPMQRPVATAAEAVSPPGVLGRSGCSLTRRCRPRAERTRPGQRSDRNRVASALAMTSSASAVIFLSLHSPRAESVFASRDSH